MEASTRQTLTIEERSLPLENTIDPGFVHKRKIETILGEKGMCLVDEAIHNLPELPEWQRVVRIDHVYKDVILKFCEIIGIKTLEEALSIGCRGVPHSSRAEAMASIRQRAGST